MITAGVSKKVRDSIAKVTILSLKDGLPCSYEHFKAAVTGRLLLYYGGQCVKYSRGFVCVQLITDNLVSCDLNTVCIALKLH